MTPGRRRIAVLGAAVAILAAAASLFGHRAALAAISYAKGWAEPMAPFRIADDLYYVGSKDLTAYLIKTRDGLILLDGGVPENADAELANIRTLGFDPRQVRILLNSHAHFDHAGVLAQIKRETGAKLYASVQDAPVLEAGGRGDFLFGDAATFPAVKVDRRLRDGETVSLGGVTLTAHVTAGHTRGCTSWSWPVKVDGVVRQALSICSVTVLSQMRLTGPKASYPGIADDFRRTFATLHALPCDLFLSSHGGFIDLAGKRARMTPGAPNPFVDPAGCRAYLDKGEAIYRQRLASERTPLP